MVREIFSTGNVVLNNCFRLLEEISESGTTVVIDRDNYHSSLYSHSTDLISTYVKPLDTPGEIWKLGIPVPLRLLSFSELDPKI
ncbi:MAG: hypothetical protein WBM44_05435 [Waterburya sp.]